MIGYRIPNGLVAHGQRHAAERRQELRRSATWTRRWKRADTWQYRLHAQGFARRAPDRKGGQRMDPLIMLGPGGDFVSTFDINESTGRLVRSGGIFVGAAGGKAGLH